MAHKIKGELMQSRLNDISLSIISLCTDLRVYSSKMDRFFRNRGGYFSFIGTAKSRLPRSGN